MPIGLPELAVVFVMVLILFGPGKLPQVFGALGDGVRQFKKASQGITDDVNNVMAKPLEPSKQAEADTAADQSTVS